MKKQPSVTVRMPEDLFRKMLYLCDAERRTPNNQMTFMLRNAVQYFERSKGRMDPAKLAAYDLTPYMGEQEQAEEA